MLLPDGRPPGCGMGSPRRRSERLTLRLVTASLHHFRATIPEMVRTLQIPYDDSVLLETSLPQADFEREAKILLAAKLFEMGRLSSGKAAELCGMGRVEFLASLQRVGVSMSNLRPEDVADEVAFAERT